MIIVKTKDKSTIQEYRVQHFGVNYRLRLFARDY